MPLLAPLLRREVWCGKQQTSLWTDNNISLLDNLSHINFQNCNPLISPTSHSPPLHTLKQSLLNSNWPMRQRTWVFTNNHNIINHMSYMHIHNLKVISHFSNYFKFLQMVEQPNSYSFQLTSYKRSGLTWLLTPNISLLSSCTGFFSTHFTF